MSLEQAIKELTEAVKENTAAHAGNFSDAAPVAAKSAPTAGALRAAAVPAKPTVAAKPAARPAPAPSKPVAKAAAAPADDGEVTYDQVRAAILALGKREGGRDAITTILGEFGVEKGPELQPDQWQEALDALNAELAA